MKTLLFGAALLSATPAIGQATKPGGSTIRDRIDFGQSASEAAHDVRADRSEIVTGILSQSGRRLLAAADRSWRGAAMTFRVKVDPDRRNYVSIRLSGSEVNENHLILSCEGKQVGDQLLGDYEPLDIGALSPQFPGSYFYRTTPLPLGLTHGRAELSCGISAIGPVFAYGDTFETFQRPMTAASRGIFGLIVDTAALPPGETGWNHGATARGAARPGPGLGYDDPRAIAAMRTLEDRIDRVAEDLLVGTQPLGQPQLAFLARVREKTWSRHREDERLVPALVRGFDGLAARYVADPGVVGNETSTWNPDWFGLGQMGEVLSRHSDWFSSALDGSIAWRGGHSVTRRQAYAEMLAASRDWHRVHRRFYTNQSMINDLYGIYLCNRGVAAILPAKALPEPAMKRYLYEAVGLEEWRGDDDADGRSTYGAGGADGTKAQPYQVAKGYHLVTARGLTRELGYVGAYGEVQDWVAAIYDGTRPAPDQPGDPRIAAQFARMTRARAPFRYPANDADGFAAMRLANEIGWRDFKSPGDVDYVARLAVSGGSPLAPAVMTGDAVLAGYAQQMLADNQFYDAVVAVAKKGSFRAITSVVDLPEELAAMARLPRSRARLPMTPGQPDFAFVDTEDAVVALKRGDEIFYASLYWRANRGVNGLGRVFTTGPRGTHLATVAVETRFRASGQTWTRPASINPLRSDAFNRGYRDATSAAAGEQLPLVKAPPGLTIAPGTDSIYAGRGDFYVMRYAGYVVAMNTSVDQPATFAVPGGVKTELLTHRPVKPGTTVRVEPGAALVFVVR